MQNLHITITHMFQNGTRPFPVTNCHFAGSIFLRMKSLANTIYSCFKDKGEFSLKDAYSENSDKPKETVRARIYDNLGVKFERVAKGLYKTIEGDESCVVIEGDGRDLSMLGDASIDCILKQIYSLNVNGMVTVVLPDFTLPNFQRLTAFLISPSNSL